MKDRAMQALYLMALNPVAETTADRHSYGFRRERCTVDAIVQCHTILSKEVSPQWILEGDIKGCFDHISHQWLLDNIPTDKVMLCKWLESGFGLKVFIRGGSSLTVDLASGHAVYESIRKRPVLSSLNRLHYNPSRWWTVFSDVFLAGLIVIVLSGLVMMRGPKGLRGRGGVELIAGILIPLLFIFLT